MSQSKGSHLFRITGKEQISPTSYLLKLQPSPNNSFKLPKLEPGQFVQILPPGGITLLRRPISICNYIEDKGELWLLIARVGRGTIAITDSPVGSDIDIILPLGNSFNITKSVNPLLIGGGVGIAPMLNLAKAFKQRGITAKVILGGRSQEHIMLTEEFETLAQLHITTDDGSLGVKGRVTEHPILQTDTYDAIYTCGPHLMMEAVARVAEEKNIYCEVSLENTMACGIGACLCCVQDTHSQGNTCVCTEGPIFNSTDIKW